MFQILDGTIEKDLDVAFFPTFVEENYRSDGIGGHCIITSRLRVGGLVL